KKTMAEFGKLKGTSPAAVPVENTGGAGTRDSHWRESVFVNELMTGFVGNAGNPLSRLTAASLQDVGYVVDLKKAEKYARPSLMALAERGALLAHAAPTNQGMVLPTIPIVLPKTSLQWAVGGSGPTAAGGGGTHAPAEGRHAAGEAR